MKTISDSLHRTRGFSLVEILSVMAIVASMAALSGPALHWLKDTGNVNKAVSELSGVMGLARAHAMANHTYVRVGFASIPSPGGNIRVPSTVVVAIYSADGTLNAAAKADMEDPSKWPVLGRPLVLSNLLPFADLDASAPDTSTDDQPADSDVATFNRNVGIQIGSEDPAFDGCIQFGPDGTARVTTTSVTRHVKISIDRPATAENTTRAQNQDPFILRVSGINGNVTVLRKGSGL